jgi:S1-C subfamily serine protease
MPRLLLALVLAAASAAVTAAAPPPACPCPLGQCVCGPRCKCPVPEEMPHWHSPRVVHEPGGPTFDYGTGTPVWSDGKTTKILTCAHAAGPGAMSVCPGGRYEKAVKARVVARDDSKDLAMLEVPVGMRAAHFAATPPQAGDVVYQRGWGGAKAEPVHRQGVVKSAGSHTFVSQPVVSGDSGSALFNARGEVVGVVAWHSPSCAVGYADVRGFLASNGVPVPPQTR